MLPIHRPSTLRRTGGTLRNRCRWHLDASEPPGVCHQQKTCPSSVARDPQPRNAFSAPRPNHPNPCPKGQPTTPRCSRPCRRTSTARHLHALRRRPPCASAPIRLADAEADRDPSQYAVPDPDPTSPRTPWRAITSASSSRTRASPVRGHARTPDTPVRRTRRYAVRRYAIGQWRAIRPIAPYKTPASQQHASRSELARRPRLGWTSRPTSCAT